MSGNTIRNGLRVSLLLIVLAIISASDLRAGSYPDHSVKVIVPFPPGGATDIAGRIVTQKLAERLGQQFFIENISGAAGNIGMTAAARAPHDGYTILLASSSIVVNPSLYKSLPFDVEKDFIPVTKIGASPNSWEVNAAFPAKTMKELIELLKANPGKYSVASPGAGTTPSLAIEMLKQAFGVNFVTVPFAGGAPLAQSLLGGFTPISCNAISSTMAFIQAGKVRALALTSKQRLDTFADVPTLDELGIKNQESETMAGVFVPTGTPQAVVELLQREIAAIVHMPDVKRKLLDVATIPDGDSSADFAAYVRDEIAKWKRVIEIGQIDRI
ncbi:MAG: Bug family tripartite tricarboxylate transporter substrate binding protein [Xanthobacteraceae bacterium]